MEQGTCGVCKAMWQNPPRWKLCSLRFMDSDVALRNELRYKVERIVTCGTVGRGGGQREARGSRVKKASWASVALPFFGRCL